MAFPITLSVNLADYGGTGVEQGSASFQLSAPLFDSVTNKIYAPNRELVALTAGSGTVTLPATKNDPDVGPTGLTYTVRIVVSPNVQKSWEIELDKDLGANQSLADIPPASHVVTTTYASVATVNSHIAATQDIHGIADTSQLATLSDVAANVPQWGNVTGTLSAQTDLTAALAGKQAVLGYTPLAPANNLSDVANVVTALDNLTLPNQVDLPALAAQATVTHVIAKASNTHVDIGSVDVTQFSYTVPACSYAVLRLVWAHVDFKNSAGVDISCHVEVTIDGYPAYRLIDLHALTDHELDATVAPLFVLHQNDSVIAYASNSDNNSNKVVNVACEVELYA